MSKIWTTGYWLLVLSVVTCDGCQPMNSGRNWSCSNSGLEVGLPDFHGRKMWRTAEKRYGLQDFYDTVIMSKIWTTGYWLLVLSVVTCDCCKQMNSCRDLAFSNSGVEVGLPAFQLPMVGNCDVLPKRDMVSKLFYNTVIVSKIWTTGYWLIALSTNEQLSRLSF